MVCALSNIVAVHAAVATHGGKPSAILESVELRYDAPKF